MSEITLSQNTSNVNEINPISLNFIEKDGGFFLTAEEIGKSLGYENPTHAINRVFRKNYSELKAYSVETKTVSTDGKYYNTRIFSEEGLYLISMFARTPKAKEFRSRVASLLREIRQNQLSLAQEVAYQEGMDYANSLPVLEAKSKQAFLDGIKEGEKLQKRKDGYLSIKKAIDYFGKGLNVSETAKLLEISADTLRARLKNLGIYEKALSGDLWWETPKRTRKPQSQAKQGVLV